MAKIVNCPCGDTIRGETDDELVSRVQSHNKQMHNQDTSRAEILAAAKPV